MRFQVSLVATGVAKVKHAGRLGLCDAGFRATVEVSAASEEAVRHVPVQYFASQATWNPISLDGLPAEGIFASVGVRSIDVESIKIEHVEPVA